MQRRAEGLIREATRSSQVLKAGVKDLKGNIKGREASNAELKMLGNTIGFISSRYSELAKALTEARDEYDSQRRDLVRRRIQLGTFPHPILYHLLYPILTLLTPE